MAEQSETGKLNIPKQTPEEIKLLSLLYNRYRRDWNYSKSHFDTAEQGVLSYKVFRDANSHPYKYNPAVPLVFTMTESSTSQIVNALFARPNLYDALPVERTHKTREDIPDERIASQLTKALNHLSLNPDRELQINLEEIIKELMLLGNAYSINLPAFDHKRESDIGGPVYLGPNLKQKSFFDVVPDSEGSRFSDCRWIWDIERVPLEEMKNRRGKGGYKNLSDAVLQSLTDDKNWIPDGIDYFDNIQSKTGGSSRLPGGFDPKSGIILLLHCYNTFTGHFQTMAANRLLIRDTSVSTKEITLEGGKTGIVEPASPFPYNPYGDLRLWSYSREFYSTGIAKIAKVYQDEVNLWKSMRFENIEMAIHKVLMYNPIFGVKEEDIWMVPAGLIKVNDVNNAIKELEMDDITNSSYVEQAQAEKNAYDAAGNQPEGRGNLPQRREAATTVLAIRQEGQKRTETVIKKIGVYLRNEGKKNLMQMRMWMSKKEYERIIGEPDAGFYNMDPVDVMQNYDINTSIPAIDSLRESEMQNLINFLQIAQSQPENLHLDNIYKAIFRGLMPSYNPDHFILTLEQKQQRALEQQSLAGPGAQQPPQGGGQTGIRGQRQPGQPTISPEQILKESAAGRLGGQQGAARQ